MPGRTAAWAPLTQEQLEARRVVNVHPEIVTDVASTDIPGHYGPAQDDSWNIERFKDNLTINFHKNEPLDSSFSLIGVDAAIANAFRRILLAEIPTLAIEDIYISDNTSIIQDEVLCHRLGLVPLTGGKEGLRWMRWFKKPPPKDDYAALALYDADTEGGDDARKPTDYNTIVLTMDVTCRWATEAEDGRDGKQLARDGNLNPADRYVNSSVYAESLHFEPRGQQANYFGTPETAIKPVRKEASMTGDRGILVAKMRPGQHIQLECHCIKGIGKDHAKFSPVATASYRLLPDIKITKPILGPLAHKFKRCFPRGVIGLEKDQESGQDKAVVLDPMKDTVSREVLRYPELAEKVKLGRIRDHFIFSVESTGQLDSDELFLDSVRLLKAKAERFKRHLNELEEGR